MSVIAGTTIEYEFKKHNEITSAYTYAKYFTCWKPYEIGVNNNPVIRWLIPNQIITLTSGSSDVYADILWIYDENNTYIQEGVLINASDVDELPIITKLDLQKYKMVISNLLTTDATPTGTASTDHTRTTSHELLANEYIKQFSYYWIDKDETESRQDRIRPIIRYIVNGETWYFYPNVIHQTYIRNVPNNGNKLDVTNPDGAMIPHDNNILVFHAPTNANFTTTYPALGNSFYTGGDEDYAVIFSNVSDVTNLLSTLPASIDCLLRIIATLGVYFEYNGVTYLGYMDSTGQTTGDYLTEEDWHTSAQWNSGNVNNFTEHTAPVEPIVDIKDKEHEMPLAYIGGTAGMVSFIQINKAGLASADDISDAISRFDIATIGKDLLRNFISFKAFAAITLDDTVDRQIKIAGIPLEDSGGNALTGRYVGGVKPIDLFPTSGGVTIPHLYNDYRDYEPYTKIQMYVPFCGWFDLPSWCIGKKVTGTMFTDLYNGTVKAVIKASETVVAEVGGCCAYDIPFVADATGMKAGAVISSALTTAAAVGGTVAMPNVATGIAAVSSAANLAATLNSNATTLKGVLGDGSNMNGLLHVYIKVSRPMSPNGSTAIPDSYKHEIGIPTMKEIKISAGDGYIQVMDAKVTGNMTAREKQMIIDGFRHGLNF